MSPVGILTSEAAGGTWSLSSRVIKDIAHRTRQGRGRLAVESDDLTAGLLAIESDFLVAGLLAIVMDESSRDLGLRVRREDMKTVVQEHELFAADVQKV